MWLAGTWRLSYSVMQDRGMLWQLSYNMFCNNDYCDGIIFRYIVCVETSILPVKKKGNHNPCSCHDKAWHMPPSYSFHRWMLVEYLYSVVLLVSSNHWPGIILVHLLVRVSLMMDQIFRSRLPCFHACKL